MVLSRSFEDYVKERVRTDPVFRAALADEAAELAITGEADLAEIIRRDYLDLPARD